MTNIGVSKNRETPQNGWFMMENPIKDGWFGGKPAIFGNIHIDPLCELHSAKLT